MTRARWSGMNAAMLMVACGTAAADVQRELITVSGRPAGTTGGLFSTFGNARLNEQGEVLFWARQTANDPVNNDECTGAIPIGLGGTLFTTRGATDSVPIGCGSRTDVWFEFTDLSGAPSTSVQFYLAGAEFSQAALGVYQNNCTVQTLITCATNGSIATVGFGEGMRTIKLRVGSSIPGQSGDGLLVARQLTGGPLIGVINSQVDGKVWLKDGAGLGVIWSEGAAAAFDPTLVHESVGIAAFTGWGSAVTGAVQAGSPYATTRGAVMSLAQGGAGAGVLAIDTVPANPPYSPTIPGPASLSESGSAAYALLDGSGVVYGATAHATGTAAPGLAGLTWLHFDQPAESASGKVAWRSRLAGPGVTDANDVALWKDPGTGPALVVRSGQQAPGNKPGVVFGQIGADVGVDGAGGVAFWGELSGPGIGVGNREGVWSDRGGTLAAVVRAGQTADVPHGAVFATFSRRPMVNARGDVALVAYVAGGDSTTGSNSAIWVFRADGSRRLVVREGDAAPGGAEGVVFATFSDPVINDRGDVAFTATLRGAGVTPQTAQALYFGGAERGLVPIARSGEVVVVAGGSRTVREVLFGTGRPQAGHGQFNSGATLLYELVFTDRSTALVKSEVTCRADFDRSGIVSVPDIFAYLSAWFVQAPEAEWDGSAPIDVADLFAFLAQWFGGC